MQFDQALQKYQELWDSGMASPSTFYNMGVIYQNKGDLERASFFYGETIRLNPKFYRARIRLGRILSHLGRQEEALLEFQEAVSFTGLRCGRSRCSGFS